MIPEILIEKSGQMMDFLKKKGSKLKQKIFGRIHEQPTEEELEREALIEALLQSADPQTLKDIEENVQENMGKMHETVKGGEKFRSQGKSFTGATMGQNVNNRAARLREALRKTNR